ncbi:MAG: LPP20 family lipoprotein [Desulfobacterales bacterium]|nr:LPP20 family lipoprotein [Desulfobacterales bacterium]
MNIAYAGNVSMDEWTQIVEQIGSNGSKINWSTGIIEAVGIGAPPEQYYGKPQARPMALRAAQVDAYRNLLETTKGVRVDSKTLVKDFVVQNDVIMTSIEGLVKGAQVVKRDYLSDGTVEVTVQMSLSGGFAQLVLPPTIKQQEPIFTTALPVTHPPVASLQPVKQPEIPAKPEIPVQPTTPVKIEPPVTPPSLQTLSEVYTGLVVDARGLNAKPAMAPKILDENGQEVYGSAFVSRDWAVQQGMSGYAKDPVAAQNNERVTDKPFIIKGIRTEGPGKADIVISNADAAKIRSSAENLSFLQKCRVMIVVD